MHRTITATIILVCCGVCLGAENGSWNKLSYIGGTVPGKVNPYDWNTTLTVAPGSITLVIAHSQTVHLAPAQVTALSYGQEAHRRVAEMVALSLMTVNPGVLFGILHQGKDHFIGIEFKAADGKPGSILLQAHKDNYKAVLQALKTAAGKPVENTP